MVHYVIFGNVMGNPGRQECVKFHHSKPDASFVSRDALPRDIVKLKPVRFNLTPFMMF